MTTEAYTNSATIGTTTHSLPNNSTTLTPITTPGVFAAFIDFSNLTITEKYLVEVYRKVTSGGSIRRLFGVVIAGPMPIWTHPPVAMRHGWDIRVTKLAGTDRSIDWSIEQF